MCLLIHHKPSDTPLSDKIFADVLARNSDGFGAMYADRGKVHVIKVLDPTVREVTYIYDKYLKDRECVMHFRMRTHGDVDYENCHPYQVNDDLHMAHNGVLSCVNERDRSKSDTWHLVEDHLRELLVVDPDLLFKPSFQKMLGAFIGSGNKLGFVRADGQIAVINRSSGFEHNGTWYSNTYAWSPERFGIKAPSKTSYGSESGYYGTGYSGDYGSRWKGSGASGTGKGSGKKNAVASGSNSGGGTKTGGSSGQKSTDAGKPISPTQGEGWKADSQRAEVVGAGVVGTTPGAGAASKSADVSPQIETAPPSEAVATA